MEDEIQTADKMFSFWVKRTYECRDIGEEENAEMYNRWATEALNKKITISVLLDKLKELA